MKSSLLSLSACGFLIFGSLPLPQSQATAPVFCVNCSSEVTQILTKATLAQQLLTQAQQLQTQLSQLQNMVTNTKSLNQNLWGNVVSDLQQVNNLFQQSKALGYTVSNLDAQFAQRYSGFTSYMSGKTNFLNKFQQWSQEARNNNLYTLKALNAQNSAMPSENAVMNQIQAMSGTAVGQKQAIQAANMIAAQTTQQIQKLRQLVMAQAQLEANYYQQLQDKEDASEARHQQFVSGKMVPYNNGRQF